MVQTEFPKKKKKTFTVITTLERSVGWPAEGTLLEQR